MIYVCGHLPEHQYLHNLIFTSERDSLKLKYKYIDVNLLQADYPDDKFIQLHPNLNEWVTQYYAYHYEFEENEKDGYVGFCHYRRPILIDNISESDITAVKNNDKIITFYKAELLHNKPIKENFDLLNNFIGYFLYSYETYNNVDFDKNPVNNKNILNIHNKLVEFMYNQNVFDKNILMNITNNEYEIYNRGIYIANVHTFKHIFTFVEKVINHFIFEEKYDLENYIKLADYTWFDETFNKRFFGFICEFLTGILLTYFDYDNKNIFKNVTHNKFDFLSLKLIKYFKICKIKNKNIIHSK